MNVKNIMQNFLFFIQLYINNFKTIGEVCYEMVKPPYKLEIYPHNLNWLML